MKRKKRMVKAQLRDRLDFKEQYHEARAYVKEVKPYIYFSIALFLVSTIAGFVFHDSLRFIEDILRDLILRTENLSMIEMVFFIMQNNMQSSFLSILFGVILGFFPIVSAVTNGVILGYVLERSYQVVGLFSWWRLLPHGVFELPAIFISFGLGLKMGLPTLSTYFQYYSQKAKIMIALPIVIALISFGVSGALIVSGEYMPDSMISELGVPLLLGFQFVWSFVLYVTLFVFFSYVFNPKVRALQDAHLRRSLYQSLNVFLMIIIPLLILAAIIEGILIGLSV